MWMRRKSGRNRQMWEMELGRNIEVCAQVW